MLSPSQTKPNYSPITVTPEWQYFFPTNPKPSKLCVDIMISDGVEGCRLFLFEESPDFIAAGSKAVLIYKYPNKEPFHYFCSYQTKGKQGVPIPKPEQKVTYFPDFHKVFRNMTPLKKHISLEQMLQLDRYFAYAPSQLIPKYPHPIARYGDMLLYAAYPNVLTSQLVEYNAHFLNDCGIEANQPVTKTEKILAKKDESLKKQKEAEELTKKQQDEIKSSYSSLVTRRINIT